VTDLHLSTLSLQPAHIQLVNPILKEEAADSFRTLVNYLRD